MDEATSTSAMTDMTFCGRDVLVLPDWKSLRIWLVLERILDVFSVASMINVNNIVLVSGYLHDGVAGTFSSLSF